MSDISLLEQTIQRSVNKRYGAAMANEAEELVEATFRVISATDNVDPHVRDILREANLSTQAFYRHFKSKDELMLVVLDASRRRLATYLEKRMSDADDPIEQIAAWIRGIIRLCQGRHSSVRTRPFMLYKGSLEVRFPDEYIFTEAVLKDLLSSAIRRGQETGQCETPDPVGDAQIIYDYTMAHVSRQLVRRMNPPANLADRLIDFALRAVRAR